MIIIMLKTLQRKEVNGVFENLPVSCGQCHNDIKENYLVSEHHSAFKEGMLGAQTVWHCHKNPIARVHSTEDTVA